MPISNTQNLRYTARVQFSTTDMMPNFTLLQWFALIWFTSCWIGYGRYSGLRSAHGQRLQDALQVHIHIWVENLQRRDNRMVDIAAIANLERNATFFASSSLVIIASLVATLGASDKALHFLSDLPFTQTITAQIWQSGMLMLVAIFAYAFFTFTWSLRQWGFASILVGSAPDPKPAANVSSLDSHHRSLTQILSLAVYHFNLGLRSYYFSLALLTWFIHPIAFIVATFWVIAVLYRREFHSRTLKALVLGITPPV